MALFLGSFEYVFEEGPAAGWIEDEHLVMWMFLCSFAAIVFFWRAFRQANPVVDLTIFKDRNFAVGSIVATIVGFGLFGSVYLTPLFLGTVRGYNALQIGQIMSVGGIAMFIGGPIAGALIRKVDPRYVLVVRPLARGHRAVLEQLPHGGLLVRRAVLAAGSAGRGPHHVDGAVELHRAGHPAATQDAKRHGPHHRLPQPWRRGGPCRAQHDAAQLHEPAQPGDFRRARSEPAGSSGLPAASRIQPARCRQWPIRRLQPSGSW
jgi:hypothetical protein